MNKIDQFFTKNIEDFSSAYFSYLKEIFDNIDLCEIKVFVETLLQARDRGANIFFIGNGGSASTCSHFANDLSIGVNDYVKPFKAVSLTDNNSIITAIGNDFGYEEIFVRQLMVCAKSGDILVGISASGNSQNLLRAFEYAKSSGVETVALTAFDGGEMKVICDKSVHIPTMLKEYGPAEDLHMILDHLVSSYLMRHIRISDEKS
jgi:D-sedoheptulose 7-phosphate isomerase